MDFMNHINLFVQVAIGIFLLFRTFVFVHEGQKGVILRFGKARRDGEGKVKIYDPGFVLMIPLVDKMSVHHVRQQTILLGLQKVMLNDGLVFGIDGTIIFRVNDVYKAQFEIQNLEQSLGDVTRGLLRDILSDKSHKDLVGHLAQISESTLSQLKVLTKDWGVDLTTFKLIDCAPTPETAHIVNITTTANIKTEALKSSAVTLGISLSELNSNLGAVLVGAPLVATVSQESAQATSKKNDKEDPEKSDSIKSATDTLVGKLLNDQTA